MTAALISGVGSGALHAVTGPDHVLSLGPVALHAPGRAARIGLAWGAGHALGTSLLALPLVALAHQVRLDALSDLSGRLAGLTLLLTAALSWWSLTRPRSVASGLERRSPLVVGLLHGATGAGALVLLLPSVLSGDTVRATLFVVAFALGSMLAMAGLTEAIGRLGRRLSARRLALAQRALLLVAAVVGASWLVLG